MIAALSRLLTPTLVLRDCDRADVRLAASLRPDPKARERSERSRRGWETRRGRGQ